MPFFLLRCFKEYLDIHTREGDYRELNPADGAYYDGAILVDLSTIEPSIAMPFRPGSVYTIRELKENAADILAGTSTGDSVFSLSVYPDSQPVFAELVKNGAITKLMDAGVIVRSVFCGPCFGAGDTPANGGFSIRHTTRNFPI